MIWRAFMHGLEKPESNVFNLLWRLRREFWRFGIILMIASLPMGL